MMDASQSNHANFIVVFLLDHLPDMSCVLPACWLATGTHFTTGHWVPGGKSVAHPDTHTAHWRLMKSFAAACWLL
jgi:hypothetical protein